MPLTGMRTLVFLSFVLALSFLLIILSCVLFENWLPLFSAVIFALTPVPNFLASRCAPLDDFSVDYSTAPVDIGSFLTSVLLVSGLALPAVMAHAQAIHPTAAWMAISGGVIGYATVIAYSHFYSVEEDVY